MNYDEKCLKTIKTNNFDYGVYQSNIGNVRIVEFPKSKANVIYSDV